MDTAITMIEQILGTDDVNRRCAVYQNLQQYLRGSGRKNLQLSGDKIRNLATIIRNDCGSETGQIGNTAWELLEYILKLHVFNGDVELIFLQTLLEADSNEKIQKLGLKTLEQCVLAAIIENKNRIMVILDNESLVKKLLLIIDDVCTHLPKDMCANCLVRTIMPIMFNTGTSETLREVIIDLGASIVNHVNINNINQKEHESIIKTINKKYLQIISDEITNNNGNWSKLWVFLIKFINIKLHSSVSLTNNILRVIEKAFRNNAQNEQRIAAYVCWRELINNLSLNMDYFCNTKQIKLIITPLKAKLSRSSGVNMERFKTFLHLFEKLQDKSVLCLKEFLDFCIGPLHTHIDLEEDRKHKLFLSLAPETIIITLLSIIGHQHNNDEICIDNKYLKFNQPIINTKNFKDFDSLLITVSYKYCLMLQEWKYEHSDTVIKCLWKSLFNLIENSPAGVCERCYSQINNILITLKEPSKNTQQLLNVICEVAVNYEISYNQLVETLFKIILNLACCETAYINNAMIKFASGFDKFFNSKKLEILLLDYYLKEAVLFNFDLFYECWLKIIDFSTALTLENRLKILNWSIIHLDKLKDQKNACVNWMKYYQKYFQSDDERCTVLQNIKKLFLNNPLLCSNVIQIIQTLHSEGNITDKESNLKFLTIIESILSFPALPHHNLQTVIAIVSTYFDKSHLVYQLNDNNSILSTLCNCIIQTVNIQKDYSLLSTLQTFFESLDKDILLVFSCNLTTFLEVLLLNDDDDVSTKATKLSQLLELDTNTTTDAMKISTISNSDGNNKQKVNPITNGDKDMKNSTKKSLNDTPLTRSSRMVAKVLIEQLKDINDESSSDFVKIDSEVRFEPQKLSEHQKEVLKKRRDDIPALYEDLSQSQTKDFTSNDGTTNENSTVKEDLHRNITVRIKNKKNSTENTVENSDNIEATEPTNPSTSANTTEQNSNIDDRTDIDNNDKSADVTRISDASTTPTTLSSIKTKKVKRTFRLIEEFSSKDYRRKKKPTKGSSVKLHNNTKSIDSGHKRHQQLKEKSQDTESDDSISYTKKKPRKRFEVLEKRQLRERKPSLLLKHSEWVLGKEHIEKKRLRRQLLPNADKPTWSFVDNLESVDEQDDYDNSIEGVNEEENKDNEKSTILDNSLTDFEVATTGNDCNKIKIGKKLLNKSIDSVNEFRAIKRKHDESRETKSLDNLEIENVESQDIIESSQETSEPTILQISPRKKQEKSSPNNENNTEIETKTTQLTDTETCNSVMKSLTPQLQLELPKKDKLTEADVEISMMSTVTLTPTSEQNNLPSSPITCDTPDRTIELINDTSDISPINTNNINEDSDKKLVKYGGNSSSNSGGSDRSRKMLEMANTKSSLSSTPKQSQIIKNRFRLGKIMSPSINIKKIKKPNQKDENLEVLTFTRNLPITGQVPGSSILKRKTESDEFLPNPKRKRVNFSDPATTSKKIIIKDPQEFISDTNTKNNEDAQIFNEFHDYMAMAIGKAAEKGLDRRQIGLLIRNCLRDNEIDINESPSKVSLKNQLKRLTNIEAANLLSDYFETMNPNDMEEIRNRVIETNKNQEKIFEKFLLELTDTGDALKISKKIDETILQIEQNYASDDDIVANKVYKWKTDKFIDLFEKYKNQLNDEDNVEERNKFLIDLMERCSSSLTDQSFIKDHFRVTENFVNKFF